MTVFLATAFSLSAALTPIESDTTRYASHVRVTPVARVAPPARVPAVTAGDTPMVAHFDKVQHFAMSYAVASFSYAAARAFGVDGDVALYSSAGAVSVAGLGKELYDRRRGSAFSLTDLVADALGGIAAYAVLSQVR